MRVCGHTYNFQESLITTYMKRITLALAFCFVISEMFAQNIFTSPQKLCISETSLQWVNLSDRIIEDKDNGKVYIGFPDGQTELILQADIKAYSSETGDEVRRNKLNSLLSADKPIFIQGYTLSGKQYIIPKKECGEMVGKSGSIMSRSKIYIAKSDLPVVLTFGGKEITLVSFDKNDKDACAVIRRYALGFTSPTTIKDTIQSEDLSTKTFSKINIKNSKYWSIDEKYFVNNQPVSTEGDNIIIPNELFDDIKANGSFTVTYNIHLKNEYFGHDFSGSIAEMTVKKSRIFPPEYFKIWHILALLLGIALVLLWIFRKKIIEYFHKRRNNNLEKIQQDYIESILSNNDDRIWLINKLLSNIDEEFKQGVLSILCIEPTIPIPPIDPSSNKLIKELQEQISQKNTELLRLKTLITEKDKTILSLQVEKDKLSLKLAKAIKDNNLLRDEITTLNDKVEDLRLEIDSLKSIIADKDKQIEQHLQKIKTLQDQLASISRQNMYLLQIDDVLKEISDDILVAVENVEDEDLKKKLVLPLLNGVSGLDEGLTTYYKRWQVLVMKNQKNFFGKDLYEMTDEEVRSKLVSGFLKNLAQGDTFSKLTRLYMYIQADWINEILIKNKFNVDKIEQIFNRLKMLFNDFGIEIIYPRLFVDKMNDQQYTFDPRCEVFKLFPINEEMRMSYSKQTDLIVDIIQIGVKIPSENYSRKAIVSIPNF